MDPSLQFDSDLSQRLSQQVEGMTFPDPNNNSSTPPSPKGDKYSLRPRSLRRATEPLQKVSCDDTASNKPSKPPKPKQKPAPLSKYRRKTANARERSRMREINQAFEALRRAVPQYMSPAQAATTNEKLTKITTLRLAMKYIASLSATLNSGDVRAMDIVYGDLDCFLLESDGESLPLSDHSLLASPDFPETSLSPVDFGDPSLPSLLHTDFTDHALDSSDFSDFLLT